MKNTLLIKNGVILTLGDNPKVLYKHSILIENGIIKKVAPTSEFKDKYEKEIDANGKVVLPGFINAHMHFYSTLVRGLGKAKPSSNFIEVLENLWWRLDKALTLEDCYYSALIMLVNSIRRGTTTFIDHHASPKTITGSLQQIAKAVKETGLRASLCYEVSDRDSESIAEEGLKENYEFIKYTQKNNDEFLKALFGLHASFTLSNKTLEKASKLGNELNSGFHIHVAEAESDEEHCEKNFGMRVVERLNKFGILGEKTIAAHCVHVNDNEMNLLKDTGTAVVHNPQSNLNNAVGIADVIKMVNKGILVGLGTDAMTVNMTEEVRVALWAQHLKQKNPSAGFMEITSTLYSNNAKIVKRYWNTPLGKIEEGAAGDIILIDYNPPTPLDENTYLGHLVFGISQSDVDTTIVNGKVLMENKILKIDVDEVAIAAKARELTKELWSRFK
ncbi:MAG: putative aminohydrolase SsnA [Ignavibacteriae bacterium]|nr:putative aminohydrolase SsnA [Ignavibacteriota bacterium]